jgi:uncharacterized protein (DUF983 family)
MDAAAARWTKLKKVLQGFQLLFIALVFEMTTDLSPYWSMPSMCVSLSATLVICDHTFQPIKTILMSLESPKILVLEKVSSVQIVYS